MPTYFLKKQLKTFCLSMLYVFTVTQVLASPEIYRLEHAENIRMSVDGILDVRTELPEGTIIQVDSEAVKNPKFLKYRAYDNVVTRSKQGFVQGAKILYVPGKRQQYLEELNSIPLYFSKKELHDKAQKVNSTWFETKEKLMLFKKAMGITGDDLLVEAVNQVLTAGDTVASAGIEPTGASLCLTTPTVGAGGSSALPGVARLRARDEIPDIKEDGIDMQRIPGGADATVYHIADEKRYQCADRQRTVTIYIKERHHRNRKPYRVCPGFIEEARVEGTARLYREGGGPFNFRTVNVSGGNRYLWDVMDDDARYGVGANDKSLVPWYTIAADGSFYTRDGDTVRRNGRTIHKDGDIIFIPKAKGILLPDGTRHTGFFLVRDGGTRIKGRNHFDLFSPFETDATNVFHRNGLERPNRSAAYKLTGEKARQARAFIKQRAERDHVEF